MIQHVKADSLADVFTDSSLSAFTSYAINKGVNKDSIIYITCGPNDTTFGNQYVQGSNWIWAKGEMFGGGDDPNKEDKSNKVTSISNSSTDTQYPSAKCVYDEFEDTVISEAIDTVDDITLDVGSGGGGNYATKEDVNNLIPLILASF